MYQFCIHVLYAHKEITCFITEDMLDGKSWKKETKGHVTFIFA